jgi:hypothetical protein
VRSDSAGFAFDFSLNTTQSVLLQGDAGYSLKGPQHTDPTFSRYYTQPQLAVNGTLTHKGTELPVRGTAWLDHEWSDSMLPPGAVGWDWVGMNLADGSALMVDRGWVSLPGNARDRLPEVAVSGTGRRVQGRLDHFRQAALREAAGPISAVPDNQPRVMNYPDAAAVSAAIGKPVYPLVLLLDGTEPDGFVREDAPTLSFGPERHLGYAIQWWALAVTLVLLWGWTALKPKI